MHAHLLSLTRAVSACLLKKAGLGVVMALKSAPGEGTEEAPGEGEREEKRAVTVPR